MAVWINEILYDYAGQSYVANQQYIEIAGTAGSNINGYR